MSNRLLLSLLAGLVAVVAVLVWMASGDGTSRGPGREIAREAAPAKGSPGDGEPATEALVPAKPSAPERPASEPARAVPATADARTEASSEYDEELASGHWIEGRVVFPPRNTRGRGQFRGGQREPN